MSYSSTLQSYLVVMDRPWVFAGVAAVALGLCFVRLVRKWAAGGVCRSAGKARWEDRHHNCRKLWHLGWRQPWI